jgi:hypothetical protein
VAVRFAPDRHTALLSILLYLPPQQSVVFFILIFRGVRYFWVNEKRQKLGGRYSRVPHRARLLPHASFVTWFVLSDRLGDQLCHGGDVRVRRAVRCVYHRVQSGLDGPEVRVGVITDVQHLVRCCLELASHPSEQVRVRFGSSVLATENAHLEVVPDTHFLQHRFHDLHVVHARVAEQTEDKSLVFQLLQGVRQIGFEERRQVFRLTSQLADLRLDGGDRACVGNRLVDAECCEHHLKPLAHAVIRHGVFGFVIEELVRALVGGVDLLDVDAREVQLIEDQPKPNIRKSFVASQECLPDVEAERRHLFGNGVHYVPFLVG